MHEHKSSVPNRGHCNFVFKSIAFHRTGEFGFDEKCTTIYHVSCVFGLAAGETARLTAERRELSSQEAEDLNRRLAVLITHLPDRPEATVEYFVPDDRKAGGAYVTVTGRVRHISVPEKTLVMEDGLVIALDDVVSIGGNIFGE